MFTLSSIGLNKRNYIKDTQKNSGKYLSPPSLRRSSVTMEAQKGSLRPLVEAIKVVGKIFPIIYTFLYKKTTNLHPNRSVLPKTADPPFNSLLLNVAQLHCKSACYNIFKAQKQGVGMVEQCKNTVLRENFLGFLGDYRERPN